MSKELLELIENVDPEDSDVLDEIDARTHVYIGFYWHGDLEPWENGAGHWGFMKGCCCKSDRQFAQDFLKYTRSRDALKAIRPEGWFFDTCTDAAGTECYSDKGDVNLTNDISLPTEELAELHAIIQAISYERGLIEEEEKRG